MRRQDCPSSVLWKHDRFELLFTGTIQAAAIADKPPTRSFMTRADDPPRKGKRGKSQSYGSGVASVSEFSHDRDEIPVKTADTFKVLQTPEGSVKVPIHVLDRSNRFMPTTAQLDATPGADTRLPLPRLRYYI